MKSIALIFMLLLKFVYGDNAKNIALLIDELRANPTDQAIFDKAIDDVASNFRNAYLLDQNAKDLNLKLQRELINFPNHAKYFAEKIEKLRIPGREGYSGCSDPRKRMWIFQDSLSHLPSPETHGPGDSLGHRLRPHPHQRLPRSRCAGLDWLEQSPAG